MANKTKATPQKEEMWDKGPEIPGAPPPLLVRPDAAVTKLIRQGEQRGYVTYEAVQCGHGPGGDHLRAD